MKVRIKGNSIRLRLSQTELGRLDNHEVIAEQIDFAPGVSLIYSLERSITAKQPIVHYGNNQIQLILPEEMASNWINTNQISIRAQQDNATADPLRILIEKDFRCLTERPNENEEDLFPHPKEGVVDC